MRPMLAALVGFSLASIAVSTIALANRGNAIGIVSPAEGFVAEKSAVDVVVTDPGGLPTLFVSGRPLSILPVRVRTKTEERYTFAGVPVASGMTQIRVADADATVADATIRVYGVGELAQARVVSSSMLHSDAHHVQSIRVKIVDRFGKPSAAGAYIEASIARGDARFHLPERSTTPPTYAYVTAPVADDRKIFVQVGDDGEIELPMLITGNGMLYLRLSAGGVDRDIAIGVNAATPRPLVVGYATIGAGPVPGLLESADNAANGTTARRGTVAIYGHGEIAKDTSLTLAYGTADVLQSTPQTGPYTDNPNDRPFPIYGDTSSRGDDALSRNRLFAEVDNHQSSAMWGEFYEQSAPPDAAGGYNLLVQGAQMRLQGNNLGVSAFVARNDTAFDRRTITPTGLAIAAQTLHPNIVVGSDVVELVHLDRISGAILEQTPLERNVDYAIDYSTGLFTFINIILPYDSDFNPQVVVIQYEYDGSGATTKTFGASGNLKLLADGSSHLNYWYVNDATGGGNLTLMGQELAGKIFGGTWSVSHEQSNGSIPTTQIAYGNGGDAWKASLQTSTGPLKLNLAYSDTTAGYNNPYGTYSTPGLSSIVASIIDQISSKFALAVNYLFAKNSLPASAASQAVQNQEQQISGKLEFTSSARLKYHVGVQLNNAQSNGVISPVFLPGANIATPSYPGFGGQFGSQVPGVIPLDEYIAGSGHSVNLDTGVEWGITRNATIKLDRTTPLGCTCDPYNPPQTIAELDVRTGQSGVLFLRQLWSNLPVQALAATQFDQTYASSAKSQTMIGFENQIGNATVDTGYAVDHTVSGTDLYAATGVRQRIFATKDLTGDAFFQVGEDLNPNAPNTALPNSSVNDLGGGPSSPHFMTLGTSLNYALPTFHATGQFQTRDGYDPGTTYQVAATGSVGGGYSLYGSLLGDYADGLSQNNAQVGMSFRPDHSDRYVTLLSYDVQKGNVVNYDAYLTNVGQLQELYRPSSRTELAASVAYKLTGDSYFSPHTVIYGLSVDQRLSSRFDIAAELHRSSIAPLSGSSATGFALETGLLVGNNLRLAAGYNFSGFVDPTAAVSPTHRGLYVTASSYIDRIFGWGANR